MLTWQDAAWVFNVAVQLADNEVHHRGVGVKLVNCRHEGVHAVLACASTRSSAWLSRPGSGAFSYAKSSSWLVKARAINTAWSFEASPWSEAVFQALQFH